MTEDQEDDEVIERALLAVEEDRKQGQALLDKYIGTACLKHGRSITRPWAKKMWYLNELHHLGVMLGHQERIMRRYRNRHGESYKRQEAIERELKMVKEELTMEIMALEDV